MGIMEIKQEIADLLKRMNENFSGAHGNYTEQDRFGDIASDAERIFEIINLNYDSLGGE